MLQIEGEIRELFAGQEQTVVVTGKMNSTILNLCYPLFFFFF